MKSNIFLILLSFLVLQGCSNFGPVPDNYHGPVITLWDNVNKLSETNAHYFELLTVDGRGVIKSSSHTRDKSFKIGFAMDALPLSRNIPLNANILHIGGFNYLVADLFGLGDSFYRIKGYVKVSFEREKAYMVNGELGKNYSLLWIENEKTGVIVSNILFEGSVPPGYLSKLKTIKISLHNKVKKDLELQHKQQQNLFNKAIAYIENNGCENNNLSEINVVDVFLLAESLFTNKKYQESLKCFENISESEKAPKQTFKYLFLIYDVGLGVKENRQKADFWKTKYKL